MAGAITTLRRALLPPDHLVKTHPEKVIERLFEALGRTDPLDVVTRRRLGDLIHFGYGALWGATYAVVTRGRRPNPFVGGPLYAALLWGTNFGGLMPLLGVQSGPWTWNGREFAFTGVAHVTYGTVTALVLDALDRRGS
ncbi:MAG: DUF1440 domain-containing protein [Actinobacteria bacterium]|nr:DUF1440 domain-containing protein [Actinomycetota bacterium]